MARAKKNGSDSGYVGAPARSDGSEFIRAAEKAKKRQAANAAAIERSWSPNYMEPHDTAHPVVIAKTPTPKVGPAAFEATPPGRREARPTSGGPGGHRGGVRVGPEYCASTRKANHSQSHHTGGPNSPGSDY